MCAQSLVSRKVIKTGGLSFTVWMAAAVTPADYRLIRCCCVKPKCRAIRPCSSPMQTSSCTASKCLLCLAVCR